MNPADIPGRHKKRGRHFRTERSEIADSIFRELQGNSSSYSARLSSPRPSVQNTMVDPKDDWPRMTSVWYCPQSFLNSKERRENQWRIGMKRTLTVAEQQSLLRTSLNRTGWALCIGAGTSLPIFPTWVELVESLISKVDAENAASIATHLLKSYSPDAVLNAVYELMDVSEDEFSSILSEVLYAKVLAKLPRNESKVFRAVLSCQGPEQVSHAVWLDFIRLRDQRFRQTSACQLGACVSNPG